MGREADDDKADRIKKEGWNGEDRQEEFPARLAPQSKSNKQLLEGGLEWWLKSTDLAQTGDSNKWTGAAAPVWPAVAHVEQQQGMLHGPSSSTSARRTSGGQADGQFTAAVLAKGWQFDFGGMQPRTAQFLQESSDFLLSRLLKDHTPDTAVAAKSSCGGSTGSEIAKKITVRLTDDTPHEGTDSMLLRTLEVCFLILCYI
jgi:hypothetical protein